MFNDMPDSVAESGMTLYAEPAWNCVTLSTEGSRGSTWRDTTPSRGVGGWIGGWGGQGTKRKRDKRDKRDKREKGFNVSTRITRIF